MRSEPVHILLVEDSPSDAALLQEALMELHPGQFRFTQVDTLQAGLDTVRQNHFDVLLLDLSLPDSSGRETFLRARAQIPALPIVVLTSVEDEAIALEAVRQGIQDYLVKTQVHGAQTVRAIRYAIERKRTEEALKKAETALQAERDRLERRVQERTAALSAANRALEQEIRFRQEAEAAHQEVLRRLSTAEETERGRISRELHDRLGQDLTTLKLGLQMLRQQLPAGKAAQESLCRLEELVAHLMQHTHRLAWELRPAVLDDLGLEMALQRYSAEWSETAGVALDFHSRGLADQRLPQEFESTLYRVAQECLTNVRRHAQARQVSVLLEGRADGVSLIIEDDGHGFDPEATFRARTQTGKLGLLGIQERVKLVAGRVGIESSPGAGTTVYVRLPRPTDA